jgi:hypothetical protein
MCWEWVMRRTNTEEISVQWVGCVVSERYYGREIEKVT